VFLERHARGVLRPRILEAFVLTDTFLHVRGCLINRDSYGACGWIRFLAGMDSISSKTHAYKSSMEMRAKARDYILDSKLSLSTRTARGFVPSGGPMIPSRSIASSRLAARPYPMRNRRCK